MPSIFLKMVRKPRVWGIGIPIKMKTRKCNSCQNGTTVKHGWILLLEKEPLTYMGDESTLYNMEMKKPRYGRNMILLI